MEQLYAKDQVQVAAFGEFMLRLHSGDSRRFLQAGEYKAYYAGAEANLSVLLARMGVPVRYITRIHWTFFYSGIFLRAGGQDMSSSRGLSLEQDTAHSIRSFKRHGR